MVRPLAKKRVVVIAVDPLWRAGVEVQDKGHSPKIEPDDNRRLKVSLGELLIAKQIKALKEE